MWLNWQSLALPGSLESTPSVGECTTGLPCFAGCAVLPMLGGPWKVHLSTLRKQRWQESAPCCHVHTWRRGPCGTDSEEVSGGAWLPWEPVSSGGGRLSGSFVGWWFFGFGGFSLAGFYFDVDKISTP